MSPPVPTSENRLVQAMHAGSPGARLGAKCPEARRIGRPVRHRSVTADELAVRFTEHGIPPEFAVMLAALDVDISGGSEDRVTGTVERVTGRPARSFRMFVEMELPGRSALTGKSAVSWENPG